MPIEPAAPPKSLGERVEEARSNARAALAELAEATVKASSALAQLQLALAAYNEHQLGELSGSIGDMQTVCALPPQG